MASSNKPRGEYISPVRLNAGHDEWNERERIRKLGRLEQGQAFQASSQNKPWCPLGERPDGGSWTSLGDRTPERSQRSGPEASLSTTAASRSSCRSPASSAGVSIVGGSQHPRTPSRPQSQASKPPRTAESVLMPPMTGSTTLSQMFRRAVSTPALRTSDPELSGHAQSSGLGGGCAGRSSEAWYCEHPKMGTSDLVSIVQHLHDKVMRERRKRIKAAKAQEVSDAMAKTLQSESGSLPSH